MFNRRKLLLGSAVLAAAPASALAVAPSQEPPSQGPSTAALALARAALARRSDAITARDRIAIADFSLNATQARFHIVDLNSGKTRSYLVAHGKGSDPAHTGWLQSFSNAPGSEATSRGAYLTGETYTGQHGLSRRLIGLDADNSNALSRAIVIHSAWYVSADMAAKGQLGRSQGCFAVSQRDLAEVMDLMGPGRLLVAVKT
ncbi:MAG TPA: murein L,D-transpeptidase catalytic domain family protein [Asticcacaulis sp.]|nr:murein L,D-transpeptidase catalytic domain family protein [Asticcacaulis sp.]